MTSRTKALQRALCLASLSVAACDARPIPSDAHASFDASQQDAHFDAEALDAASVSTPFRIRWTRVREDMPYVPWETSIAYDPLAHRLVEHGGHLLGSYVQTGYTTLLDLDANQVHYSTAPERPQRRCITDMVYASSVGASVSLNGSVGHGSLPTGIIAEDGTRVRRGGGGSGPWLYDALRDRWQDTRPPGVSWPASAHTPIAYEPGSDAVFAIVGDVLTLYQVSRNEVATRALPESLRGRLSYGIAVDPLSRNVLVFGGTGPRIWVWERDPLAHYDEVWRDTWLYQPATDTWRELALTDAPPRGVPMANHIELPMVFEPASRSAVLLQTPLITPSLDAATWPPMELWRFDFATERWLRGEMIDAPALPGLLAYDSDHHALVHVGGGRDTDRPSTSRHLYMGHLEGAPPTLLPRIRVQVDAASRATLTLDAPARSSLTVERAELVRGIPATYVAVGMLEAGATSFTHMLPDARAYAFRLTARGTASHAALTTLPRSAQLTVRIDSASQATLHWEAVPGALGYNVYRGPAETAVRGGSLTRITTAPIPRTTLTDSAIPSATLQAYVVRAVDARGLEGAPSAVAYTVPDAPRALDARVDGSEIVLSWELPASMEGTTVRAFAISVHRNTHGFSNAQWEAFWAEWQEVGHTSAGSLRVPFQPTTERPHLYLYVRAENNLGQLGFYTDIISPTDTRFRPGRRDAPNG